MKLLLNSHDDAFYKLYEKSLIYEGTEKTSERYITKKLCKEWSDGYNIQEEYGYRYLHSGNVLLFKVYNDEKDTYSTLIIHLNGDIECIIENNTCLNNSTSITERLNIIDIPKIIENTGF